MHFMITGHTGFKGTWLAFLLHKRGHSVSGLSLDVPKNALSYTTNVKSILINEFECDVRNHVELTKSIKRASPDVVIHMAAQALVRESYKDPLTTFETNVNGTLNVLKACQETPSIKAILAVTTDKVYKNRNTSIGHVESDELGGGDPYSASKAMADIAVQSWISSFPGEIPIGICRAGNVIGGGDISVDRLVPDLIGAYASGRTPILRYPNAIRPWQHVLDCLNGYLMLLDSLLLGKSVGPWNFGPSKTELRSVEDVASAVGKIWGVSKIWESDSDLHPEETLTLVLDSQKAPSLLGWENKLDFAQSVEWTANWYKDVYMGDSPLQRLTKDIDDYEEI